MQLIVNGKPVTAKSTTLASLCEELGFGDTRIATALNADFVAASERANTLLKENDQIEIVSARQGG